MPKYGNLALFGGGSVMFYQSIRDLKLMDTLIKKVNEVNELQKRLETVEKENEKLIEIQVILENIKEYQGIKEEIYKIKKLAIFFPC